MLLLIVEDDNMKNLNTPTLKTERLILRRFEESDLSSVFDIYSNKEVNKFLPWLPAKNITEAKLLLDDNYLKKYENKIGYDYAICLKENNIPIGYLKIAMNESYDLGFGLLPNYWNKGIVTEAVKAIIGKAKIDGIPYLTATHDVGNPASGAVMIKSGMKYKYSYEEQWQPKDIKVVFRMYQINLSKEEDFVYNKYWNNAKVKMIEKI